MKNKIITGAVIFCLLVTLLVVFVACDNPGGLGSQSGSDKYGREFGSICDIDGEETGIYEIDYEIDDTSTMGKTMIGNYCYNKVKLAVSAEGMTLTFYCKNNAFSNVKLDSKVGESIEESDMYGYTFEITREALNNKLAMTGYVSLMKRDVAFSINVDLSNAKLIG